MCFLRSFIGFPLFDCLTDYNPLGYCCQVEIALFLGGGALPYSGWGCFCLSFLFSLFVLFVLSGLSVVFQIANYALRST